MDKKILNKDEIEKKIKRISLQIIESNISEEEIIIIGIYENGFTLAGKLSNEIKNNSAIKTLLDKLIIDKKNPRSKLTTSLSKEIYKNKSIIIIDDVLNTGSTLMYAIKHILNNDVKKIQTAVLVDRNHKKYPVKVDFKGLSLSTSIHNHVEVSINEKEINAFLV
tara:strand:+ start:966 stop:1460 length:495 start_codon:yes stop_codon:yes gene_type:complete